MPSETPVIPANFQLTEQEIQAAFEFQRQNRIWTFYDERAFIEQLFCTRFNYFLVMIGIFLGGALSARSQTNLIIILSAGLVCVTLMALVIYRAFDKLIVVLKIIYRLGDDHVFAVVQKQIRSQKDRFSISVNHILGVWFPCGAVLVFLVGLILAICGVLTPGTA